MEPKPNPLLSRENLLVMVLAFASALGCGRPATAAECDEIVARITELELRARGGAGDSSAEVRSAQEALKKTSLQSCVGRRISDEAMTCVRTAKTAQALVTECF
jgi:small lipoprotein (TIGR04454 family)